MNTIHPFVPSTTPAEPGSAASEPGSGLAASGRTRAAGPPDAITTGASAEPKAADRASLQSTPEVGNASPPFDGARVSQLRTQIASGRYVVDARATAAAMLSQMLDFHGIA